MFLQATKNRRLTLIPKISCACCHTLVLRVMNSSLKISWFWQIRSFDGPNGPSTVVIDGSQIVLAVSDELSLTEIR